MSNALRSFTNIDAFSTIGGFAGFLRAFDLAFGLLALNIAEGVLGFLASCVATWWLAYWVANWLTLWFIALPGALGMALWCILRNDLRKRGAG